MDEPADVDRTADTGQALTPALLTAAAAAVRIGVNERTIRRAIARGDLRARKHGGVYRITLPDLNDFQMSQVWAIDREAPGGRSRVDPGPPYLIHPQRQIEMAETAPLLPLPAADRRRDRWADLPRPLTPFIGRERESSEVRRLLQRNDVRLLTLTGPGGIGKTRLAVQVAAAVRHEYADGVVFVALYGVDDAAQVLPAIAHALAIRYASPASLRERLRLALRERWLLLVLDNFEHVLGAGPDLIELLAAAPGVKMLVTSRERLHLSSEHDYLVPPLTLPSFRPDAQAPPAELVKSDAVQLFVTRAQAVLPGFGLVASNAADVAGICTRLDGIPLAIELAATRSNLLTPGAILDRLDHPLPLLTGGARDLPSRHQSMRDTIAWSHDLLSAEEQALFRRLAVFTGGCTVEGAEAVAGDVGPVFELMFSLAEKCLFRGIAWPETEPRFGMLETIREYGLERLEVSGEADAIQRRHAEYVLSLVERLEPHLRGAGTLAGLDRLMIELPNLRTAVTWSLERDETALALRLVAAIYPSFWFSRGDPNEGRRWLEVGLGQGGEVPPRIRVDALDTAAMLTAVQGEYRRALSLVSEADTLARAHGYPFGVARAQFCLATIAEWQGDFDGAAVSYETALQGMREHGDPYWIAMPLTNLAVIHHLQGRTDEAAELAKEALTWWQDVGNPWGIAMTLTAAAAIAMDRDDHPESAGLYREALNLWLDLHDRRGIAGALAGLAGLATDMGQPEAAARVLGAVSKLVESIGVAHPLHPAAYERAVRATRAALPDEVFGRTWAAGRQMPLAEVVALAVSTSGEPAGGLVRPFGLTTREAEIARLLADRATNREIAETLFISPRTVGRHVENILQKLGVESRRDVAERIRDVNLG